MSLTGARAILSGQWLRTLRETYAGDLPGELLANRTTAENLDITGAIHIMPPVPHWHRSRIALVGSPAAAADCGCASPPPGPGPGKSPRRSPGCRPSRPADQHQTTPTTRKDNPRARGTPPTRRGSRAASHGHTLKSTD